MLEAIAALLALGAGALFLLRGGRRGSNAGAGAGSSSPAPVSNGPDRGQPVFDPIVPIPTTIPDTPPPRVEPPAPRPPQAPIIYSGKAWNGEQARAAVQSAADRFRVPFALLAGIASAESYFDPNARGSSGEVGMFQIMPAVARVILPRLSFDSDPELCRDIGIGALVAASLLVELRQNLNVVIDPDEIRSWEPTVHGYNRGQPSYEKGNRSPEYVARVFGWIDRHNTAAALVPIDRAVLA